MEKRWGIVGITCLLISVCGLSSSGCRTVSSHRSDGRFSDRTASALVGAATAGPAVERRFGGVFHDAQAERRMSEIGRRIAAHAALGSTTISYQLLNSDEVNAISLPEGRVYLTRGLYEQLVDDSLLAAVLAHEFAHIAEGHGYQPRCRTPQQALAKELAADARGIEYLRAAGFSNRAMCDALELVRASQPPDWISERLRLASK